MDNEEEEEEKSEHLHSEKGEDARGIILETVLRLIYFCCFVNRGKCFARGSWL